jgi:hypothetical protein
LTRNRAREQLRLIETSLHATVGRSRHPSDNVDVARIDERGHLHREPAKRAPRIAVLEAGDELAAWSVVGQDRVAPIDADRRR